MEWVWGLCRSRYLASYRVAYGRGTVSSFARLLIIEGGRVKGCGFLAVELPPTSPALRGFPDLHMAQGCLKENLSSVCELTLSQAPP